MISQFQKKVQNIEDGILEYVAKRQTQNILKIDEKNEKKEKGYFDRLKDKMFNDEPGDNQQKNEKEGSNKNDIVSKLKERLGMNDKEKKENEENKGEKKGVSQQIKVIHEEYTVKAKKYANDIGDQFNKLFKKKAATQNINENIEQEEQKEQNINPQGRTQNVNGWIIQEEQGQQHKNSSQNKNQQQQQYNQNNRIFHNKYDSDQESDNDISYAESVHEKYNNQFNQQQNRNNHNNNLNNNNNQYAHNHQGNNRLNTEEYDNSFQQNRNNRKQVFNNQIPQNSFQVNQHQNIMNTDFDRSFNDNQNNREQPNRNKSPMVSTKRKIFADASMDNDDSYSQNQGYKGQQQQKNYQNNNNNSGYMKNNSFNQVEQPNQYQNQFQNQQRFMNNMNNDNRYVNQQQQFQQNDNGNNQFRQSNEFRDQQNHQNAFKKMNSDANYANNNNNKYSNNFQENNMMHSQNQSREYYENFDNQPNQKKASNMNQFNNGFSQNLQQNSQRRRIFNKDDSDAETPTNQYDNQNYNQQQNFNNEDQKSVMNSSMMSASTQRQDLNNLADVYFTSEFDFEKVLQYEINQHFGRVYQGMNEYEKRHVFLEGIDKAVNRIEILQNYNEQVKEQIGENAMQNQHTLYMGTEMIKVVATVTDDTLGKVQKSRVKLQNYKMLYIQKLKQINKLVKRKKRLEYVTSFLEKFQLKYSCFIYSAKIGVNMNNISQFEDLLVLLDSCNQQYIVGQQSSSMKVLKCLSNVQIYVSDKLNLIYQILQNFLTTELFSSFDPTPNLKLNTQVFNIEKYKYVLRSYFALEKQLTSAIPLPKTMIQYVKKALDISVLRSFQSAQTFIEKKHNLYASQRHQDGLQFNQYSTNLNQLQYMTGEQFAESMKRIFHHITLLLFNLEQCQRFHSQYQSYSPIQYNNASKEMEFLGYLAQLDQAIQSMKGEISSAVLNKINILIQSMNIDSYSNGVIDKVILMISQMLLIVKEYDNDSKLEDTIQILKKVLMIKLRSHADTQINQMRQAILKDNWSRNKLPDSYINNLYFSLLKISSKNERDGHIMQEQSKRIFNPSISVKAFTSQNRLLSNYSVNSVFAETPSSNLKPFQQISMKDPDDPIDDLDQTTLNMINSDQQNALFQKKHLQPSSRNSNNFFEQTDLGNIGLRMYESVRPEEHEEVGQCCSSTILLIECVHSYLQLMKYLTPIGYEIFLEVQKIIEFYFYQTFTLFIDKKKVDDLINANVEVHNLSPEVFNVVQQLNDLAPYHETLLTYLSYKELRTLIIRSRDYFESETDQINNSLSQTQHHHRLTQPNQNNNVQFANCNQDFNIFSLNCANNNYQMSNIQGNNYMQSSSNNQNNFKATNNSYMQNSVMSEASQMRRQKLMIQFDLQQRLSSVQSIYSLNKYLHLVEGQIVQNLSLIDTTSQVQNFVSRIIHQEIQNYLKQMKNFIIRDYCLSQLEKDNIFQDFALINWKQGDYTIDTQKPLFIDNSLFFLREFKQKIEKDQNNQNTNRNYGNPNNQNNSNTSLSQTVKLDIYRNVMEAWMQVFLKNISLVKKYSDKGRAKLYNHYQMFLREVDQLIPVGHLKIQNDIIEKFIKIWNTNSAQELLSFVSSVKNQVPLAYLISIISSNDRLTLFLSSSRQFDTVNIKIYKEFLQFVIDNN